MSPSPAGVIAEIHGFSELGAEPVPWPVGLEHVAGADTFWLSTVRPDVRPHVTPLTAVWHDDAIWFSAPTAPPRTPTSTQGWRSP
jgi:Pyridoxamine 5'-phosphate oxidase